MIDIKKVLLNKARLSEVELKAVIKKFLDLGAYKDKGDDWYLDDQWPFIGVMDSGAISLWRTTDIERNEVINIDELMFCDQPDDVTHCYYDATKNLVYSTYKLDYRNNFLICTREAKPVMPVSSKEPDRLLGTNDRIGHCLNTESNEAKIDQSWYEKGELPPVGEACQWKGLRGGKWVCCEVVDIYQDKEMVVFNTGEYRNCKFEILNLSSVEFRPIQSERDKLISLAIKTVSDGRAWHMSEEEAGILYDAGMLKRPSND